MATVGVKGSMQPANTQTQADIFHNTANPDRLHFPPSFVLDLYIIWSSFFTQSWSSFCF